MQLEEGAEEPPRFTCAVVLGQLEHEALLESMGDLMREAIRADEGGTQS
jgi:hypothetical protein